MTDNIPAINDAIGPKTTGALITQAFTVASEPIFLAKIDAAVGAPIADESRAAYIQRGREAMVARLMALFG